MDLALPLPPQEMAEKFQSLCERKWERTHGNKTNSTDLEQWYNTLSTHAHITFLADEEKIFQ